MKHARKFLALFAGIAIVLWTLYLAFSHGPDAVGYMLIAIYASIGAVNVAGRVILARKRKRDAALPLPADLPVDWRAQCISILSGAGVTERPHVSWTQIYAEEMTYAFKRCARFFLLALPALGAIIVFGTVFEVPIPSNVLLIAGSAGLLWYVRGTFPLMTRQAFQGAIGWSATHALSIAQRPPILYLRSFDFDATSSRGPVDWYALMPTSELALTQALARHGPVLAIGRPGESGDTLGAIRFHVGDAIWRSKVEALVPLCQLVVWTTGHTEGLRWEIAHLLENVSPERLLLWLHVHVGKWTPQQRASEWEWFLHAYRDVFPRPLPRDVEHTQFIAFDDRWTPTGIPGEHYRATFRERIDMASTYRLRGLGPFLKARLENTRT